MAANLDVFKRGIIYEEMPRIAELDTGASIASRTATCRLSAASERRKMDDVRHRRAGHWPLHAKVRKQS
jgi:hypothetical protein